MKSCYLLLAGIAALSASPASAANLLVNGDFEASSSQTATPPGWTNIGHSEGVIAYAQFGTPAYDGNYYYDIGGFGSPMPNPGDGIMQTVATVIGQSYTLTFGYSSEGVAGQTFLDVLVGSQLTQIDMAPNTGFYLNKAFTTTSISYVADSAATTIKFLVSPQSASFGNNDPLIDRVSFSAVPEPATWALMIGGLGLVGTTLRRRGRAGTGHTVAA